MADEQKEVENDHDEGEACQKRQELLSYSMKTILQVGGGYQENFKIFSFFKSPCSL